MQVSELQPDETVYLDSERLEEICFQLGYSGGEAAICAAMEDLAVLLHQSVASHKAEDLDALELTARQIYGISHRIGMSALANVADDVLSLCTRDDAAALAATVARMRRLGEQSLLAIWDRQDLSI